MTTDKVLAALRVVVGRRSFGVIRGHSTPAARDRGRTGDAKARAAAASIRFIGAPFLAANARSARRIALLPHRRAKQCLR
jgi:hypothetical protein